MPALASGRAINMMNQEQSRINEVTQICIEYCQLAADFTEQVAAFAAGLKAAGWSEVDAQFVERNAINALRAAEDTPESLADDLP
jgi:hypothetical protein